MPQERLRAGQRTKSLVFLEREAEIMGRQWLDNHPNWDSEECEEHAINNHTGQT